ncbi:MAG: adenosine kinase [Desulfobacterales bacterium]|nr:adenosine kinase [Desulfobacterales bacterium]
MEPKGETPSRLVVGVGSALVDILVHEEDAFLQRIGAIKGGMTYVDKDHIDHVLTLTASKPQIVPGGSACNTAVGVGKLGGQARFVGKSGSGDMGRFLEAGLRGNHVDPVLFKSPSPTGRVLSVITPDAQRSMLTFLGAAAEALPEEVASGCLDGAAIVHIEGYLLFNPALIRSALTVAKAVGALISLDLASYNVVEASREMLDDLVDDFVDILIANEDEARAFTGHSDEEKAIAALGQRADIAVLKVGPRGSYVAASGKVCRVSPLGPGTAVDTTGAGDLWASGFLFGLVSGYPLERCGELGSACGYEVCQVVGAAIPEEGWARIRRDFLLRRQS